MKKILVAVDMSGSVNQEHAKRFTSNFISTLCPDNQIDLAAFDWNNCDIIDSKTFFSTNVFFGGGSGTSLARSTAEDGDYDHLYIITDGYMDKHDLEESDTVSVVIYEEA